MKYTMTSDRVIDLADMLGYGIDIDFTGRKPIIVKTLRGTTKKFPKMEDALRFLEQQKNNLTM